MEAMEAMGVWKVVPCGEVVGCLKKQKRKETQNDAQTCLFDVEDGCARSSSFVLLPPHSITVRKKWEVFTTVVVVVSYSGALPCPHNIYDISACLHNMRATHRSVEDQKKTTMQSSKAQV